MYKGLHLMSETQCNLPLAQTGKDVYGAGQIAALILMEAGRAIPGATMVEVVPVQRVTAMGFLIAWSLYVPCDHISSNNYNY